MTALIAAEAAQEVIAWLWLAIIVGGVVEIFIIGPLRGLWNQRKKSHAQPTDPD